MGETVEQQTSINDLEKWVESNGPRLFLYAQQQTSCYADAEDVYQEALIRILEVSKKEGGAYIPHVGKFFLSIKHRAIDLHRSRSSRSSRESTFEEGKDPDWFIDRIEQKEEHDQLQSIIRTLPKDQQEVLILKIWGGLTFQSISEMLAVSSNTVASRYRYAIGQLRSSLRLKAL